jgi:hypothetical protein|tara:strand:- start:3772 stop:3978 length:207 start_codon:yes stop_codon:yes gene_type:complete
MEPYEQVVDIKECVKALKTTPKERIFTEILLEDYALRDRKKYLKFLATEMSEDAEGNDLLIIVIRNPL